MRALLIAVTFCIGAGLPGATAQTESAVVSEIASAQLVERAERIWAEALVTKDLQQLSGVLDPKFRLVAVGNASSLDHEAYLQQQSDIDRTYGAMTPTSIDVSVNGNIAVAVVSMTVDWPESFQHRHRYWQFTDIWMRERGEWRALSRVSQPLPSS